MSRRVYLSGPITLGGTAHPELVEEYKARFAAAIEAVRAAGNEPLSPTDLSADADDWGESWSAWMRRALVMMLDAHECWFLPDWFMSPGAHVEMQVARALSIPCTEWRPDGAR